MIHKVLYDLLCALEYSLGALRVATVMSLIWLSYMRSIVCLVCGLLSVLYVVSCLSLFARFPRSLVA